jgi:hypothetical protein
MTTSHKARSPATLGLLVLALTLGACGTRPPGQQVEISVHLVADGSSQQLNLPAGSTVQAALSSAGVSLGSSDRVDPPFYTVLKGGETIVVTRIQEQFETRQEIIPFARQELRNESMPAGETRLIQAGQNGLREVTIRHVLENGVEVGSGERFSEQVLQSALPEIVMVGVQSPFAPIPIPGVLAYLTSGNAWIMTESTSNRRPLVTTGDLDGYIFRLSPDGKWLLFTRKSSLPSDQQINTLWAVETGPNNPVPVDLGVSNVVHFADWRPGEEYNIAFSTVEPRATAPGWQANNDLYLLLFEEGQPGVKTNVVDVNSGGIYGWWGMDFAWSPDGSRIAYSRPDGVGLVDLSNGSLTSLLNLTPLNTHADWAWTPGLAWSSDNRALFVVVHAAPSGLSSPEESTNFNLNSLALSDRTSVTLAQGTGMFAYPSGSLGETPAGLSYRLAYLQAISPNQSATSRYRLVVANQDGSDPRELFPSEGVSGLEPQVPVWAPRANESGSMLIAVLDEGNLWLVDATGGQVQQVTGDGLAGRIDWK